MVDDYYGHCNRLEQMAEHALATLPARFALLGHSMGARIALEIYRIAPHRITRLALVSTGIHEVRDGEAEKRHALLRQGRDYGIGALCDAWLPPMLAATSLADPLILDSLTAMVHDAGVECYSRQIEALLNRREVQSVLQAIDVPTVAIVGENDQWSPVSQHRDIVAAVPACELSVIQGAGHMLPSEQAGAFQRSVAHWYYGA
ncbi:alpha/beta fold hydrolase [Novosphingobium sp.]|uniref:alpha/beta fold hydrolase n=1 Tax=Novosphingobium sp. TaxID=1874826 RepID=UPI003562329C